MPKTEPNPNSFLEWRSSSINLYSLGRFWPLEASWHKRTFIPLSWTKPMLVPGLLKPVLALQLAQVCMDPGWKIEAGDSVRICQTPLVVLGSDRIVPIDTQNKYLKSESCVSDQQIYSRFQIWNKIENDCFSTGRSQIYIRSYVFDHRSNQIIDLICFLFSVSLFGHFLRHGEGGV